MTLISTISSLRQKLLVFLFFFVIRILIFVSEGLNDQSNKGVLSGWPYTYSKWTDAKYLQYTVLKNSVIAFPELSFELQLWDFATICWDQFWKQWVLQHLQKDCSTDISLILTATTIKIFHEQFFEFTHLRDLMSVYLHLWLCYNWCKVGKGIAFPIPPWETLLTVYVFKPILTWLCSW